MNTTSRLRTSIYRNLHLLLPLLFLSFFVAIVAVVHVPCVRLAVHEAQRLLHHYTARLDTATAAQRISGLETEIAQLDSMLRHCEQRARGRGTLVDELYVSADSAGFSAGKIEVGMPLHVDGRIETAVAVEGAGSYRSTGRFAELIENSAQATRIRQLIVKTGEQNDLEVFFDIAVREEPQRKETGSDSRSGEGGR
jgi:hypothetical protein